MKTHTHLILSFLFLFQFGFCEYNTEELKEIYGDTDPCEHYILKYSMDEIKALDDRDFKIYEMQFITKEWGKYPSEEVIRFFMEKKKHILCGYKH